MVRKHFNLGALVPFCLKLCCPLHPLVKLCCPHLQVDNSFLITHAPFPFTPVFPI
ncbi:hypothetical protein MA16_Dca023250 [Dendrobium catenatum]|uniref:Uncharacterized protein n=1 Tax=Dendrobium catenatum TaxID=906689 RepID=A0A2I0W1Z0_9ASPA|nr:hypothetical protein MA16_Dca023250 [Dendrobium catenatum]